jgi:hypothetical protein
MHQAQLADNRATSQILSPSVRDDPSSEILERPCGGGIVMANLPKDTVTSRNSAHRVRLFGGAVALLLTFTQIAAASPQADDQPLVDERNAMRRMNEQIQELQARVKELEARLNGVNGGTPHAAAESSATASAPVEVTPPSAPPSAAEESQDNNSIPSVKLRMFGDVGYEASDQRGKTNSFHIGTLDLFMTGALTDRVSILGEVLFTPNVENSFGVDVERLLLQYKQNDYFNFSIGRYHSSIG